MTEQADLGIDRAAFQFKEPRVTVGAPPETTAKISRGRGRSE
jgi:hypothetical protein